MRVAIEPVMLRWARERASLDLESLQHRFPKLADWEDGAVQPTIKQLENFAKVVHVPFGYLFLKQPPAEPLPIPDFRTINREEVSRPSPELLDTIYACQERQGWYKEYARMTGQSALPFIGSASITDSPRDVAQKMQQIIGFDIESRSESRTWQDALRFFVQQVDKIGVLVLINGVVCSNNRRKLSTSEFRGFALSDKFAPLIFINGTDSKSAQMFTLAHELAHLWLNTSGVSNVSAKPRHGFRKEEIWCNAVAAEFLVPLAIFKRHIQADEPLEQAVPRLAKTFKVSTLVVLRRLLDANFIDKNTFDRAWNNEVHEIKIRAKNSSSGGDFYRTTAARLGQRLVKALIVSTLEGQTLYRDAFRMLGITKPATFENLGRQVGVML